MTVLITTYSDTKFNKIIHCVEYEGPQKMLISQTGKLLFLFIYYTTTY